MGASSWYVEARLNAIITSGSALPKRLSTSAAPCPASHLPGAEVKLDPLKAVIQEILVADLDNPGRPPGGGGIRAVELATGISRQAVAGRAWGD